MTLEQAIWIRDMVESELKEYDKVYEYIGEKNKEENDIKHQIELGEKLDKWARIFKNLLKDRRIAKNRLEVLEVTKNNFDLGFVNKMNGIIGKLRQLESNEEKFYVPRVREDLTIPTRPEFITTQEQKAREFEKILKKWKKGRK